MVQFTGGSIDIGDYAAPVFANLDSDQDVDLLVGKSDGTIVFYKNNGTAQAATFQVQEAKFQGIDIGSNSTPFFQDLTGDGLADILSGESGGKLRLYDASKKVTSNPDPGTTFKYDALGNRIAKKTNGNETRYVNDVAESLPYVLAELNSSNQPQSLNLYAGGLTSFGSAASPSRLYPLTDPLGNIRFLTDSTGTLVARYAYDPHGNIRKKEGNLNSIFTFAGEQFDPEISLIFLRARYYDPSTGTFLARDPVLGPLNTPIEHGEYLYARNNPVNLSDPSGEISQYIAAIIAGVALDPIIGSLDIEQNSCVYDPQGAKIHDAFFLAGLVTPGGEEMMIGKSFGKLGTVVRNTPGIIRGLTEHGAQQTASRGVTQSLLKEIVQNPLVTLEQNGGTLLRLTTKGGVVLNDLGQIVTAYTAREFKPHIIDILSYFK